MTGSRCLRKIPVDTCEPVKVKQVDDLLVVLFKKIVDFTNNMKGIQRLPGSLDHIKVIKKILFYRGGNNGSEKWSDLLRGTQ